MYNFIVNCNQIVRRYKIYCKNFTKILFSKSSCHPTYTHDIKTHLNSLSVLGTSLQFGLSHYGACTGIHPSILPLIGQPPAVEIDTQWVDESQQSEQGQSNVHLKRKAEGRTARS